MISFILSKPFKYFILLNHDNVDNPQSHVPALL